MDERRQLILGELKAECAENKLYEFEYYWEIWGVNWYPRFIEFATGYQLKLTFDDISEEDLNYLVEIGELEVVKVYDLDEMQYEFNRIRYRLKNKDIPV